MCFLFSRLAGSRAVIATLKSGPATQEDLDELFHNSSKNRRHEKDDLHRATESEPQSSKSSDSISHELPRDFSIDEVILPFHPEHPAVKQGITGHLPTLTNSEKQAFVTLRELVERESLDVNVAKRPTEPLTTYLLRFLRARKFDVQAALLMLRKDIEWRKSFGVDDLRRQAPHEFLGCDPTQIQVLFPHRHHGFDRLGCPIFVKELDGIDADAILELTSLENFLKFYVSENERSVDLLATQATSTGFHTETFTLLLDIQQMTIRQVTRAFLKIMKAIAEIDQDHYPERMGSLYIINPPWMFHKVWGWIKPFVDPATRNKMVTTKAETLIETLTQRIPIDQIPAKYGGSCRCDQCNNHLFAANA